MLWQGLICIVLKLFSRSILRGLIVHWIDDQIGWPTLWGNFSRVNSSGFSRLLGRRTVPLFQKILVAEPPLMGQLTHRPISWHHQPWPGCMVRGLSVVGVRSQVLVKTHPQRVLWDYTLIHSNHNISCWEISNFISCISFERHCNRFDHTEILLQGVTQIVTTD